MKNYLLTSGADLRRVILFGMVVAVPIFFLRTELDPFNVPKLALLIAGVVVVLALRVAEILQGADWRGLTRLAVPGAAVAGPVIVAWLASPYKGWALFGNYGRFQGLLPYLTFVVFGLLLADAFEHRGEALGWAFTIAGAVMGGYAVMQVIGLDPFDWALSGRATDAAISTIGNPNFTGGFLAIVLPVSIGIAISDRPRRSTAIKLMALIAAGWILSFSQGGWIAGAAGLVILGGYFYSARWRFLRPIGLLAAGGALLIAVGSVMFSIIQPQNESVPPTIRVRGQWWVAAGRMAVDSPVVGRGPNTFAIEGSRYRTERGAIHNEFLFADDPHSVFLSFLTGAGILGAAGYLTVLGWAILRGLRLTPEDVLPAAFFAALAAYFVQSLVSIDELSLRLGLWTALAGLTTSTVVAKRSAKASKSVSSSRKKRSSKGQKKSARTKRATPEPLRAWPALILLALATLGAVVWSGLLLVADARAAQAVFLFREGRAEEAYEQAGMALGFRDEPSYLRAIGAYLEREMLAAAERDPDAAKKWLDRINDHYSIVESFPEVRMLVDYAGALDAASVIDESNDVKAIRQYEQAYEMDHENPLIRVGLAEQYLRLEMPRDAIQILESDIPFAGDERAPYWALLARARAIAGDPDAAEAVERALALDPDNEQALEVQKALQGQPDQ